MGAKDTEEFGLEVFLLVMFALACDVLLDGFFLRLADLKHAVPLLPSERAEVSKRVMHPLR